MSEVDAKQEELVMVHRAADFSTAQEVFIAVELARQGAASALIERLTGFGARWVRGVVRANGGALDTRHKDPVRWFERDPQRLLHGRYVQMAYELQPANEAIARRLLATYSAYRRVAASPGILGINECAQLIDLYQKGEAQVRDCRECQEKHLVIADRATCPICRMMKRDFCRGCEQLLPEHSGGRHRDYCDTCSPRSVRLAIRRRERLPRGPVRDAIVRGASASTRRGTKLPGSMASASIDGPRPAKSQQIVERSHTRPEEQRLSASRYPGEDH